MSDEKRLHELCELTSKEQDPEKLIELAAELNRILESKENKLRELKKPALPEG